MATQIFVKEDGEYFSGWIDFPEQMIDGEREYQTWIERTDYLEPVGLINIIKHKLFPKKEFHVIIAKGNQIHGINGNW